MGDPRPRNLPAGTSIPVTAKRPAFRIPENPQTVPKKARLGARRKTHLRKATAELRRHCHAKPFVRGSRESAAHPRAAREFFSARGAREGCGTSRCRRCIRELRRLLRNSGLRDRAKSPRCGKLRESAAKRRERPLEFPARRAARKAWRRDPRFRCVIALLPAERRSKHSFADDA